MTYEEGRQLLKESGFRMTMKDSNGVTEVWSHEGTDLHYTLTCLPYAEKIREEMIHKRIADVAIRLLEHCA